MKTYLVFVVLVAALVGDGCAQDLTSQEVDSKKVFIFWLIIIISVEKFSQNLVLILYPHKWNFVVKKKKRFEIFMWTLEITWNFRKSGLKNVGMNLCVSACVFLRLSVQTWKNSLVNLS